MAFLSDRFLSEDTCDTKDSGMKKVEYSLKKGKYCNIKVLK